MLRAVVSAYVGHATPVGSGTIAQLLPEALSSASVRNTLAELSEAGCVTKAHASSGRIPTERGLRLYVDQLLGPRALGRHEARDLAGGLDRVDPDGLVEAASRLLSERSRQLGFVVVPRLESMVLQHLSLVRLSTGRVLAVLVSSDGATARRIVEDEGDRDQRELDEIASFLNERLAGSTLAELRHQLRRESRELRGRADRLRTRALRLAQCAVAPTGQAFELVIATRLALLDQPEFRDPDRLRELFRAIERRERLAGVLDQVLERPGVNVKFGGEVEEPALRHCALVVARYGSGEGSEGVLGVIGPRRMDYGRVIPLVDTLSHLVTEKLCS